MHTCSGMYNATERSSPGPREGGREGHVNNSRTSLLSWYPHNTHTTLALTWEIMNINYYSFYSSERCLCISYTDMSNTYTNSFNLIVIYFSNTWFLISKLVYHVWLHPLSHSIIPSLQFLLEFMIFKYINEKPFYDELLSTICNSMICHLKQFVHYINKYGCVALSR